MRTLAVIAVACSLWCGCSMVRTPSVHGSVYTPPSSASKATEDLIAQKAAAAADGKKSVAKALAAAISDQNKAEINTELRWLIVIGALCAAAGIALAYYGAFRLGSAIALGGAALITICLIVSSLLPWMPWFALAAALSAIGALVWHLRHHVHLNRQLMVHKP